MTRAQQSGETPEFPEPERQLVAAGMSSLGKSWNWLLSNRQEIAERVTREHGGAWVAIVDGELAGICPSRPELHAALDRKGVARSQTFALFINSDWLVRPAAQV